MKNFKINEQLATSLLNYLASQRYADVFQLVQALQNLQPLEETSNVNTTKPNTPITNDNPTISK